MKFILNIIVIVFILTFASCTEADNFIFADISFGKTQFIKPDSLSFSLQYEIDQEDFSSNEFYLFKLYRINSGEWNGYIGEQITATSGLINTGWNLYTLSEEVKTGDTVYFQYTINYHTGADAYTRCASTVILYTTIE